MAATSVMVGEDKESIEWKPVGCTKCCKSPWKQVSTNTHSCCFAQCQHGCTKSQAKNTDGVLGSSTYLKGSWKTDTLVLLQQVDPATSIQMASSSGNPSHPHLARLSPNTPGDWRKMDSGTAHVPGLWMYESHSQNFFFFLKLKVKIFPLTFKFQVEEL